MNNAQLIHASLVRLKKLVLEYNDDKAYEEYSYKFKKIMEVLDDNSLSIPRVLEDFLFDAGLPENSDPKVWWPLPVIYANVLNGALQYFKNRLTFEKINKPVSLPAKRKLESDPSKVDFLEYHKAHGHASIDVLQIKAQKDDLTIVDVRECRNCTDHSFMLRFLTGPRPETTSKRSAEKFHCYLSPEFPNIGFTGVSSYLLILDDYSKMMFIYTIKEKDEILSILVKFLVHCSRFKNETKTLVTQDLAMLRDKRFMDFLIKRNIKHKVIGSKYKDEFVDYYARSIQVMLKLMMTDADNIDESLWSECIKAAAYVYNNLSNPCLNGKTPCEIWLDKTLVVADCFYPFGKWFMAQFADSFNKYRIYRCRFVGYHPHRHDHYRFYNPRDETIGFGQIKSELFEKYS